MHTATDEEENVYELKFGGLDFEAVQSLTQDEIFFLLSKKKEALQNTSQFFDQTYNYLERVATVKAGEQLQVLTLELAEKLRSLILQRQDGKSVKLHPYEMSSLANLVSDSDATVEEVLSLVPSLSRFPDDQIEIAMNVVIEAKGLATGSI